MRAARITTLPKEQAAGRELYLDWILVACPGIIWGTSFLFVAEGLRSIGPNGIAFAQITIGFLVLSLLPGGHKSVDGVAYLKIVLLGFLWFALRFTLFTTAQQSVSSAVTGMLNGSAPLFVAIVASFLAKKLPPGRVIVGIVVGMCGTAFIALPSLHGGKNSFFGILLVLTACCAYGFALNLARPLQQQFGALPVIRRSLGAAAFFTLPLGALDLSKAHWALTPALCVISLGVFNTGIAFVLMTIAAGRVGATQASAATFLVPPIALALGVVIRHEQISPLHVIGSVICVTGAWMIRPRKAN